MKPLFSRLGAALLIATFLLASCTTPQAQPTTAPSVPTAVQTEEVVEPAAPKQLVIAMNFDVADLDPARAFSDTYLIAGKAMYDQLTEVDPVVAGKINPLLAEKWEISADELSYVFTLRAGVKFVSGNELTANDVVFSLTRLKNLKGNPSFLMDGVDKVEAVDAKTVKFTLAAPDASFLSRTAAIYMGILDSEVAKANGCTDAADADTTDTCATYLNDHSIGSGPYTLSVWERDSEIVLTANENYWRGKPNFDQVIIKLISDPTTQAQMLKKGDIDIAMNIDADTVSSLESESDLVVFSGPGLSIIYLAFNTNPAISEVTANQKFRQAVMYAIDYEGLTESVLSGYAVHPPSILPIGFLGAETVEPIERDLDKARELLAEAGYPDGVSLDVHYATMAQFGIDFGVLWQKLQSDLAEVNIDITLIPEEFTVFIAGYRAGEYPLVNGWQTPDYPDPHANTSAFAAMDGVFAKRMSYVNEANDALVKQSVAVSDPAQREEIYRELLTSINEDAVFIGVVQAEEIIVYSAAITGYRYDPVSKIVVFELDK